MTGTGDTARYCRQSAFAGIGEEGQARIGTARVALFGCGALGSVIADQLVRAGVGELLVIDRDLPDLSNLQRQALFDEDDLDRRLPKAVIAAEKLGRVNSQVKIEGKFVDVKPYNILSLLEGVDLAMDAFDNMEARYLLNDGCVKLGIPWIYCAAVASTGMTFTVLPRQTACLRCVFPEPPPPGALPTCASAGILAPAAHAAASLAAGEALKILSGARQALHGRILYLDVWSGAFDALDMVRAPAPSCPCCAMEEFAFLSGKAVSSSIPLCGRDAVQVTPPSPVALSLPAMAERLRGEGSLETNEYMVRARLPECVMTLFPDGRALFEGVSDPAAARTLYARYVGT